MDDTQGVSRGGPVFRVFLSSTAEDLERHRAAVLDALRIFDDVKPINQENFGARGDTTVEACRELVTGCDLVVAMVAYRYGWVPTEDEDGDGVRSITALEVDAARAAVPAIPVLVFVVDPAYVWNEPKDEDAVTCARSPEERREIACRVKRLREFKQRLAQHPWDTFTSPDHLAAKVAPAVANELNRLPDVVAGLRPPVTSPAPRGGFVGRVAELGSLEKLIDKIGGERPIVLTGMAGGGKTSLARELIRQVIRDYPGGEISLTRPPTDQLKTASEVFREWAADMGLERNDRDYNATDMRRLLNEHRQRTICLIDDAWFGDIDELATIIRALPAAWPRLVTTRDREVCQGLDGKDYRVPKMLPADALALIRDRLHAKFDEAAANGEAEVESAIDEHEEALVAFAREVEWLPLALGLGIGRCNNLPQIPLVVQRLVRSLDEGVDGFMSGAMEVSSRNHSLAASLSISLEDLIADSERLGEDWAGRFRDLGVLPDGCELDEEFLQSLWGVDDADGSRTLRALTSRHLLDVDVSSGQYRTQRVLRAFATSKLNEQPDRLEATRQRYHRVVVKRAKESFAEDPDQWSAKDVLYPHLARVLPTVTASLEDAAAADFETLATPDIHDLGRFETLRDEAADDVELGTELAAAFRRAASHRPWWGEVGTHLLEMGLICARAGQDHGREAEYLGRLGSNHATCASSRAEEYFEAAERVARRHDLAELGDILTFWADSRRTESDWPGAEEKAREALELHRSSGNAEREAETRVVMGDVLWRRSRLDEAAEQYMGARRIYEQTGQRHGLANVLHRMAANEFNRGGRYEQAIELFEKALVEHEALDDLAMQAEDLNDLGACHRYLGHPGTAESFFERALALNRTVRNRRLQAINLCNIAGALCAQEEYDLARQRAEDGRALAEEINDKVPRLWGLVYEGLAWQGLAQREPAERLLAEAVALAKTMGNPRGLAGALARLGMLLADQSERRDEGIALIEEAIGWLEEHDLETAFSNVTLVELRELREALRS